jgi:N6-L-threonylcarbamoyladenine synthase/tRNA threonylcarbamoyladenosine biosynthesis protein TsaB
MRLLAFDTSTAQGSVAVFEGERLLAERCWRRAQSHSEYLTSEIDEALKEARLTAAELDALAVGQGPGSFTGIRVAINAARALGYALQKPVYVYDTSEILAEPITREEPVLVLINAQKNSFFASVFEGPVRMRPLELMTLDGVQALLTRPHVCVGDGCEIAEPDLRPGTKLNLIRSDDLSDFPLAASLARLAIARSNRHPPLDWNAVQPLYIRASGAEEKLREGSKKT